MKKEKLHAPICFFGGKGNMLAKLMTLVPQGGKPYVEPYMGAASLFFARDPAPVEVLNDRDGDLVNLFRCFQDREIFEELRHRLHWTPYARDEFARAIEILNSNENNPVLRAWAYFVVKNMGINGNYRSVSNWSRAFCSSGGMAGTINRWVMRLSMLDAWRWRLMHAQIDNRDALEVIRYWDNPDAVFYIDPPYHPDTRKNKYIYAVELSHDYYIDLVQTILACRGAVVLSCYNHDIYTPPQQWHARHKRGCLSQGSSR